MNGIEVNPRVCNGKPVIEELARVRFVPMLGQDKKKDALRAPRP